MTSNNTQPTVTSSIRVALWPLSSFGAMLWAGAACALLVACATPPAPPVEVAHAPAPLACPPAPKLNCPSLPAPAIPPVPPAPPPDYRGRLAPALWAELPDWGREALRPALEAFVRGCPALAKQDAWKAACDGAQALSPTAPEHEIALFFETGFDPWQVINADGTTTGMITGYYEPLLHGSRTRTARYRYPIYGVPPDLLVIDLSAVYPEFKHRRLRGRLEGNRVVPYFARSAIDGDPAPLKGLEIAWVDNPIDLFFLHIQGSGQVELPNGERLRVGYADQNGHPFRSLGRLLIDTGEIRPEHASMKGIKDWARNNPRKVREYLDANPSYVFFRELPRDLPGPLGSLGVPLTPERSLAVDPRVIPLGVPVYLATTWPDTSDPLERLMAAQDTGGAINGGVRADFFWGFGDDAGAQAGKMRQAGRMWVLYPKGFAPPPSAAQAARP